MFFARDGRSRDRRRRWTLGVAYICLLASCDSPLSPDVEEVVRLEIDPAVLTLVVGGSASLVARVYGVGDVLLPTARVFWSTQDPTVVAVDQQGRVSAVAAGTGQIAASAGGQSRTIAVTVSQRPIALVRITPPAANVVAGGTLALTGEALDGTGELLPNRLLEWSTSAPTIATVNNTGVVTGVAVGQATISATGEGRIGTSVVTVVPSPVVSITVQPNGGSLPAGGTMTLTATPRDAAGQPLTGRSLEWRSSNDGVATVSASGLLTAISPGVVTITVSAPGAGPDGTTPTAVVTVTVLISPVASAVLVPSPASLQVGQTVTLTVNLFGSSGEPLSLAGRSFAWSSSAPAVATVNSSGTVSAVTVGSATITATITTPGQAGTIQATAQVSVSNQPVASVVVTPSSGLVHVGYSHQFTAVARDANGQILPGRTILWTSANQGIAIVDAGSGVVGGVSQGSVAIRATSEGVQGEATVTVDLVRVSLVSVQPPTATLMPAQTLQLTALPRDSAGNVISGAALGGRPTTWVSNNTPAATVSASGLVTAVAQGQANVIATIGGTGGQSAITVNPLPSASQLTIVTQPSPAPQNDIAFPVQPVVQLKDASGNNVATAGIVIQAALASGAGTLGGTLTATTNASGTATFSDLKITGTTGARTLTFTSGALTPATSAGVNLQPGTATQLALTSPPPSTANSGQVFSSASVVQLRDVSGNNVLQGGISVSAAVSPSAGVTLAGGSATTDGNGAASFGALTLTGSAGGYTLTFSSGSLTPVVSGAIALSAGSGSRLALSVQPSPTVQNGVAFPVQPVVQLQDGAGNPVTQAGVVVSVAILSGGGTLGGSTTASTNASGVATFSGLSISGTIGVRTLLFGATGYTTVTSNAVNVTAGPAAALVISVQPSATAQSGTAFTTQPSVQLRDAGGNAVSQGGVVVSATLNGAGASLTGSTTATTNAGGTATFSGLGLSGTVGTYSLSFSSGSLTGATSNSIALSGGAAAQLTMSTQPPASVNAGTAFSTSPAVQLRDGAGNPLTTNGVSVSVAISAGGATLTGTTTQSTSNGIATFTGLGASGTPGSYTLSFSSSGLTGATSSSFNVVAPSPSQLTVTTQPAGAASGTAFTTQPRIQVRDAGGNPVSQAGISVTASIASGPGGAALVGSGSATTNASGLATFSGLGLTGTVGNYTIAFASAGLTGVTSATIALGPGAPALLTIVTQPAGASSGAAFTTQPAVQVRDAQSNPVTTAGIAVTAAANGGASLVGSGSASTNSSGVATFSGLGLSGLVGSYTVTFSSSGTPGVTSASIALGAGAATALIMSTQPSATVASGSALATPPAVRLRDGAGNLVSQAGVNVTVAIGSGASLTGSTSAATNASGIATFTGLGISGLVGSYTLTFASGGLTGTTSSSISVTPGPATQLAMVTQPPASSISGSAFSTAPAVRLRDAAGNSVSQSGVNISAAVTGGGASIFGSPTAATNGSGVATFSGLGITGAGSFTLTFSGTGLTSVVSSAIVVSEPATQLSMSSQPSATAQSGVAFGAQPAVQLRTAGGNPVNQSGVSVTAEVTSGAATLIGTASATTNASGIATFTNLGLSGTIGSYTLTFKSAGLTDAVSSAINLTAGAAAKLQIIQQPSATTTSGQAFAQQPIIQLLDAQNNVVTTTGINVSAAVASGPMGGSVSGGASVATNSQGRAVFATLGITGPIGTYTISFSATGLTGVTSSSILVAAFSFDSPPSDRESHLVTASPTSLFYDVPGAARLSRGHETASLSGTLSVAAHTLGQATFPHLTTDQTRNHALTGSGRIVVVSNALSEAIANSS